MGLLGIKDLDKSKGIFISEDDLVINYDGNNYYRACGVIVVETNKGSTTCVKRAMHPSNECEDYAGNTRVIGDRGVERRRAERRRQPDRRLEEVTHESTQ